jgi:hypothetical protein
MISFSFPLSKLTAVLKNIHCASTNISETIKENGPLIEEKEVILLSLKRLDCQSGSLFSGSLTVSQQEAESV